MLAAVQNIHHRHRHFLRINTADVTIQRYIKRICRCICAGERYAQYGICAESAFVRRAVERYHRLIYFHLLQCVHSRDFFGNNTVYVGNRFADPKAAVACASVTQFHGLKRTRGRSGRNGRTAYKAAFCANLGFDGRISSRIQNFTSDNAFNFS